MQDEHTEVKPIFRKEVAESVKQPVKTREFFTKYEQVALIAMRAQQLADGAKPLVDTKGLKPSDPEFIRHIAKREIEQQKLPYIIRRRFPDGTSEYWNIQDMEIMWTS
jgi:DNA-directed RNA polymerase subunit K/omega